MYSNNDPHGWDIRERNGAIVESGFSNYAKAAARIREYQQEAREKLRVFIPLNTLRGTFFPVRSR